MSVIQIIAFVVAILLAVVGGFLILKKSKKHSLMKWVGLFFLLDFVLSWILPYGYYNGVEFLNDGIHQEGITDIPYMLYNAVEFAIDKIIFLLSLGVFYAVLSKCNGYKKLVHTIAEKLKGKEVVVILVSSLVFTAMASLLSNAFIALIFVPFAISILLEMKLDKITAFCATFGSILIGTLGITYGGEGLLVFNNYTSASITTGLLYRLIILVVSFALFNFFTITHAKKVKKEHINEVEADPFKVEKVEKKGRSLPIIILFILLFALIILGYVRWETTFGITVFTKFHEWLMGVKIGNFEIFKVLIGSFSQSTTSGAFGYWNLFHASIVLVLISAFAALINRVKLDDFIAAYGEGVKKIGLPLALYMGSYMIMLAAYMSPFIPTITNMIFGNVKTFNPFLGALVALIANTFHVDFGLTGFLIGTYFVTAYQASAELIHTIFTTMYGYVGLFVPTSGMLLIGLSYLNIDYKTWMKYIWMFAVGILVILLVLYTVMAYI